MRYGVSYYPEHKRPEELEHDLELLLRSGINTVRMGEFSWCRMEPEDGVFDFDWLKKVIERLGEGGIKTILCTPTATPPAWLIRKHPDVLYMDNRRIRRPFGGRRHYCYNNETYRQYSVRIATKLAEAFADCLYIEEIQIDNEPAQEGTGRCCCPVCEAKFHTWLQEQYGTIEEFNRRSGSIFWSQEYTSFEEIGIPVNTIEVGARNQIDAYYENPTVRLAFERFASSSQIEYQNLQAQALRAHLKVPVTTNATGLATNSIDYYQSFASLDQYTFDYYPNLRDAQVDSFPYAFARGIKEGVPFGVMEFMSGGGHRLGGSGRMQPNPGALKQAVVHSMACGSDLMLHFQFRSYPFGAEQLNYAIVDLDGVPRRRYKEMQETAALLKQLTSLEKAEFPGEVAICFDYDSHWALRIKPVNDPLFHYISYCEKCYHMLEDLGVTPDVVSLCSDFERYKIVFLPAAIIMSREVQQKIRAYVEGGGIVIATFLTSVKNPDNVGYTDTLPAGLTDVFGCSVEEVEPVFDNHTAITRSEGAPQNTLRDALWSEILGGASEALWRYASDYKDGCKVVSKASFGKGEAYYFGTDLPEEAYEETLREILDRHGILREEIGREAGVEVITRFLPATDGRAPQKVLFLFNFTGRDTEVTLPAGVRYEQYLTKEIVTEQVRILRNGFIILTAKE